MVPLPLKLSCFLREAEDDRVRLGALGRPCALRLLPGPPSCGPMSTGPAWSLQAVGKLAWHLNDTLAPNVRRKSQDYSQWFRWAENKKNERFYFTFISSSPYSSLLHADTRFWSISFSFCRKIFRKQILRGHSPDNKFFCFSLRNSSFLFNFFQLNFLFWNNYKFICVVQNKSDILHALYSVSPQSNVLQSSGITSEPEHYVASLTSTHCRVHTQFHAAVPTRGLMRLPPSRETFYLHKHLSCLLS